MAGSRRRVQTALARAISILGEPARPPLALGNEQTRVENLKSVLFRSANHLNRRGRNEYIKEVLAGGFSAPSVLEASARKAERDRNYGEAAILRGRAYELEPTSNERRVAYALSLTKPIRRGIVREGVKGLKRDLVGHHAKAAELLERAVDDDPRNLVLRAELGRALLATGKAAEAISHLETAVEQQPSADLFATIASAYRRPDVARFDRAFEYYSQALELSAGDERALEGLTTCGLRHGVSWTAIWAKIRPIESSGRIDSAFIRSCDLLFAESRSGGAVRRHLNSGLVQSIVRDVRCSATLDLLVARVQFAGELALGYSLRTAFAERDAHRASLGASSSNEVRRSLAARTYSGHTTDALRLVNTPVLQARMGKKDPVQLAKLRADVALFNGDIKPLVQFRQHLESLGRLQGEGLMSELTNGKRVAIVGPASTVETYGRLIDEFDVVVRPNFQPQILAEKPEQFGSRTDITYYSGQDLSRTVSNVSAIADRGDLKLVVARPFSVSAVPNDFPWLRFMRHEYSMYYRGTPQGISRIVYDILQFLPEEIVLFNVDFYSGASAYAAGYRSPALNASGAGSSFINDMLVVHDLSYEFRLMQAMQGTGLFRGEGIAGEVLDMEPDEYIHILETRSVLAKFDEEGGWR